MKTVMNEKVFNERIARAKEVIMAEAIRHDGEWYNQGAGIEKILSKLIINAGQICEFNAFTIYVKWRRLLKQINQDDFESKTFVFAFSKNGVDDEDYFKIILEESDEYGPEEYGMKEWPYKSILLLDAFVEGDKMKMALRDPAYINDYDY